jgi:ornithine--oxo-acid transaminase
LQAHNVLFIADEVQTGIARTGIIISYLQLIVIVKGCENTPEVKPDILISRKAISVEFILFPANNHIMNVIQPGQHGSTFEEINCSCSYCCT